MSIYLDNNYIIYIYIIYIHVCKLFRSIKIRCGKTEKVSIYIFSKIITKEK